MQNNEDKIAKQLQAEIMAQELRKLEAQYQELANKLMDVQETIKAIDQIEKQQRKNKEKSIPSLIPIGSGIYTKGEIKNTDKLIVTLTRKYAIEVSKERAREMLKEQERIIEENMKKLEEEFSMIENELSKIMTNLQ